MKKVTISQNEQLLKAIEPNDDIYDIKFYSGKSRNKTKPRIAYQMTPTMDDINKIHIKTNSNYINITTTIPKKQNINHKYSLSYSECIPPKKYYSKFQHFKNLNNNKYNDVNYYYIPGFSYQDYLSQLNNDSESNEKLKNTFQQTETKKFNETFDEQLYNKLMFFDKLANNISKEHIYSSSEYIVDKINKKENIEKPECIIHNIFLTLVLKNIYRKIEIRRTFDNKIISIDYVYSLLQNEIEKMRGAIKKSIKLVKNEKVGTGNNRINSSLGIKKYLNTDFISYIHFSKNSHIRNISNNNNSETRYTDILNGNDEYSMKYNNNSGIIYENDEKYIHSKYNYKFKKNDESDKGDYSDFVDFNNDFIDYNSPYHKMVKNKSGFIIPNILQKGIFVKNKNIDLIDSKTGKPIFNEDGSFNVTFYDKKGNKIKNPDLNDNSIEYYDKNGNVINIKKIPKVKFYDKEGNIIENPNLEDSNIKYYDENGKEINTQSRIQIQLYDKKGRPISKIDNSDSIQYYDEKGNPISKIDISNSIQYYNEKGNTIQIPKKIKKEIKVPEGYKFISNDEGKKIIIPEGYKYISNSEGEKILVDEKGNKVNENDYIVNIESESESEIEVEGINEKGEKIMIKVNKKDVENKIKKKKKKKKKIKKIRKNENGDIEEYFDSESYESENDESESEEIEIVNEKGEKIKVKINPSNLKKKKKKIKYKIKNEKGEEITISEEIDDSNVKNESEYEDEEEEEVEDEEEIEVIDNNGNKVKKKVKKIIKKKIPKKKINKEEKNKMKKLIQNNEKRNSIIKNNEINNNENENNENIKNEKKVHTKHKKKHSKNKAKISEGELNNENKDFNSEESKNKTQDENNNSNDNLIKSNKRYTNNNNNNISNNNNNNNKDYIIESEDDEDNEIKTILQRTKYDQENKEKNKKIEEYNEKVKQHKKEIEAYLNNMQKANLSIPKKEKGRVDPYKLRKLIEEVRNNELRNSNSDKKITDEDIYNKISKESELYKEWIKIGNNFIFEEKKENKDKKFEDKNYSLVGKDEFLIYKGKNYFENKKEESNESKPLPQEFVNWLKAELRKLENSYTLKKKDRSSVNSVDNMVLQSDNSLENTSKRSNNKHKITKKQIPKKKLNHKQLKTINYYEEEDVDKLPTPISRSESSDSIKSINNTQSLKYLFEQIQKLKNLPPEEYTKKVNSLLDYQLDNTQVMLYRKHADRINKFIENLEYYRKSRINFQRILSGKLSYLPPIIIKKLDDDDKKKKKYFLSAEKTKGSENILIPRNKTKNIIENMKI